MGNSKEANAVVQVRNDGDFGLCGNREGGDSFWIYFKIIANNTPQWFAYVVWEIKRKPKVIEMTKPRILQHRHSINKFK